MIIKIIVKIIKSLENRNEFFDDLIKKMIATSIKNNNKEYDLASLEYLIKNGENDNTDIVTSPKYFLSSVAKLSC